MDHTKETWRIIKEFRHFTIAPIEGREIGQILYEEDARRIVACVNACAGIETETLESIANGGDKRPPWLIEAWDEIASLRAALAEKMAQIEAHKYALGQVTIQRDEARGQVESLREFAEHIDHWSSAYPEEIFPTPTPEQIDQVCKTLGFRMDRISAMILRETVKPFGKLAREALSATAPDPCTSCAESVDGKPGNGACQHCLDERSNT